MVSCQKKTFVASTVYSRSLDRKTSRTSFVELSAFNIWPPAAQCKGRDGKYSAPSFSSRFSGAPHPELDASRAKEHLTISPRVQVMRKRVCAEGSRTRKLRHLIVETRITSHNDATYPATSTRHNGDNACMRHRRPTISRSCYGRKRAEAQIQFGFNSSER